MTALEMDVFSAVEPSASAEDVAIRTGADPRAMAMLLHALVALGALAKREGRFMNTPTSRTFGQARKGLLHTVNRWQTWGTLTACVRAGTAQSAPPMERDPGWTEDFIEAMDARARDQAPALALQVEAARATRMLDVGGGSGIFAIAFAQAAPGLRVEVLDLPAVLPITRRHIQEAGLQDRITLRAGDLVKDELGSGFDLVLLSAICHMLDEAENQDLFRRVGQALVPGGRVIVRDFLLEPDRAGPREAALFALNMLVGTRSGNVYTEEEYQAWMGASGLGRITRLGAEDLLVAEKL
jgi:predicted O-methyltransferase YrrM